MSHVVKKSKETGNIIWFSHNLLGDYLLKQKAVVVKPPQWKFIAILVEMPNLKDARAKFLPDLGQNGKKTDNIQ